jgi:alpha-tubulin suppressor-like RCC1 family protein
MSPWPICRRMSVACAFLLLPSAAFAQTTSVAPGEQFACALTNGVVRCWGDNTYGQLADGSTTPRAVPRTVGGLGTGVLAVASGHYHGCAITSGGTVRCWGDNDVGQLGDGTWDRRSTPVAVSGLPANIVAVAAGSYHTCALTAGGAVWCWGYNGFGQLGNGTDTDTTAPVQVSGLATAVGLSLGADHSCAVTQAGAVRCWGDNTYGQLGDGTTTFRTTPVTAVAANAARVSAGYTHTCAVTTSGGVQCWGDNIYGQLGDGTTVDRHSPVSVSPLSTVADAKAGGFHSCALTTGGAVACWGLNASGQVGDGTTTSRSTPATVTGLGGKAVGIGAGYIHSCAVSPGGGIECWGDNESGQLGNGVAAYRTVPTPVQALGQGTVASVAAGVQHTCFVTGAGAVSCTGYNANGQLGDGTTVDRLAPVGVTGLSSGVAAVSAGYFHTCALTTGGAVRCWGDNSLGQLGDGTNTNRPAPTQVTGLTSGVLQIAAGSFHTCAITASHTVVCWGYNAEGELGDGSIVSRNAPSAVGTLTSVASIATGYAHTCAVTSGGVAYCWGDNYDGELGIGSTVSQATPAQVTALGSTVASIDAGSYHTCAVSTTGTLKCWGANSFGELGDGTTTDNSSPVTVSGIGTTVASVSLGDEQTCAVTTAGALWCWGRNDFGQLGDGTLVERHAPVLSRLAAGVASASAGASHTCALAGSVTWCWGDDAHGELGLGAQALVSPVVRAFGFGRSDFDHDDMADVAVYRPASGTWFSLDSSAERATYRFRGWGVQAQGDVPVVGDFDGDGLLDPTVFRPASGTWFVLQSRGGFSAWTWFGWGAASDTLMPGDYDGDGRTDAAVYRSSTGTWYVRPSSGAPGWSVSFGQAGDLPIAGDFDGDGIRDIAVYRPSTGTWFWLKSSTGFAAFDYRGWGVQAEGDVPAPADYDGDGRTDLCVFRPSSGTWFVLESHTDQTTWTWFGWGASGDTLVPADYDGDGKADAAVFRASTNTWHVRPSSGAAQWSAVFGQSGDVPLR